MASNSLNQDSKYLGDFERKEDLAKNHYFDNETVEHLMYQYVAGACIDVSLRDAIMEHASELIRQIIKAHNLAQICPGKDDTCYGDLFQTAWAQVESTLYKYDARPYCKKSYNKQRPNDSMVIDQFILPEDLVKKIKKCPVCSEKMTEDHIYYKGTSKIFNLWSQVSRTCALAYIKKENRDRKNGTVFQTHLKNRQITKNEILDKFFKEVTSMYQYNDQYIHIIESIKELYIEDEKPYDGFIGKIVEKSKLPRSVIVEFLTVLRLRANEFTNSPINEEQELKYKRDEEIQDAQYDTEMDGH